MFGMSPKQFARVARIDACSWRRLKENDFSKIVGVPPAQLVRLPAVSG